MLNLALFLLLQQAPAEAPAPVQPQAAHELLQVKTVYLLPMSNGFDQYLANRLTRDAVVRVVADPQKADAILTDRLGKGLEAKLEELYPDPAKLAEAKKEKADEKDKDKDKDSDESPRLMTNNPDRLSSFGKAKGTVFLVHRGSRNIIWSAYERPKSTQPDDLDNTATTVARNLAQEIDREAKATGAAGVNVRKRGSRLW